MWTQKDLHTQNELFSVLAYGYIATYVIFYVCLLFKSSLPTLSIMPTYYCMVWLYLVA